MKLKGEFINGPDDETITVKIIKELTALKDTGGVSSEQVLVLAQRSAKNTEGHFMQ